MNKPQLPVLLIVEDEADLREAIVSLLEKDFVCAEASNGEEAIDWLQTHKCDAILTDFSMPKLNGFEFVKRLHEAARHVPIIVLTGNGTSDLQRRLMAYNIFDFLEKPFDGVKLRSILKGCLRSTDDRKAGKREVNFISKKLYKDFDIKLKLETAAAVEKICMTRGISLSSLIEELIEELPND